MDGGAVVGSGAVVGTGIVGGGGGDRLVVDGGGNVSEGGSSM